MLKIKVIKEAWYLTNVQSMPFFKGDYCNICHNFNKFYWLDDSIILCKIFKMCVGLHLDT